MTKDDNEAEEEKNFTKNMKKNRRSFASQKIERGGVRKAFPTMSLNANELLP